MPAVDHGHIPENQADIHAELQNWSRWVRPRGGHGGDVHPMFRQYRAPRTESHARDEADGIRGQAVEKIVGTMPRDHATALRWWYVFPVSATKACRHIGCTHAGLAQLVIDARTMVRNRLRSA